MVAGKMVEHGQNGVDKMVYRQNGIGQNGKGKLLRIKWYLLNHPSIRQTSSDNMIFHHSITIQCYPFGFLCFDHLGLLVTFGYKYNLNSIKLRTIRKTFTISSATFCSIPLSPHTIMSTPFCS